MVTQLIPAGAVRGRQNSKPRDFPAQPTEKHLKYSQFVWEACEIARGIKNSDCEIPQETNCVYDAHGAQRQLCTEGLFLQLLQLAKQ
jgi:hypothetical protein